MTAFSTSYIVDRIKQHVSLGLAMHAARATGYSARNVREMVLNTVAGIFSPMMRSREIDSFNVAAEIGSQIRLGERDIPMDAKPGDKYGSTGLIVSSDGNGRGVVFDPLAKDIEPGQILVKVWLRPSAKMDIITLDVTI